MNIFDEIKYDITEIINRVFSDNAGISLSQNPITAESPKDSTHGDIATNAAMVLAKPLKKNPREVAELIKTELINLPIIAKAEIAGPGFINITLTPEKWQQIVKLVLDEDSSYGTCNIGKGEKVNIEYVSANPTGPMHIGHARNAIYGDVLATLLLRVGYNVTKEYYVNDAGTQVDTLARSAMLRYMEALGKDIGKIPEGLYPGDYLKPVGEGLKEKYGDELLNMSEEESLEVVKDFTIESMLLLIKSDLGDLGIQHDVFTSEKNIKDSGKIEEAFEYLNKKSLIYQGKLPPPKGKQLDNWEETELTLFKSSEFGDDSDRPLKKRSGEWTYIMPDIAYHYDKFNRGFNNMILVLSTDHIGYQKRLQAAVKALSDNKANLKIQLYQTVKLLEDGNPVKMSKRSGNFLTVAGVIDEIGKDILRFTMLTKKHDTVLEFDLAKAKEQSMENPVFYVQYASARINSVLRKAAESGVIFEKNQINQEVLLALTSEFELNLIKKIAEWPKIIEASAKMLEPHRLVYYLTSLSESFHSLWNSGKNNPNLRFIIEGNSNITKARLALIKACFITIKSGLNLLGVEPVTEM